MDFYSHVYLMYTMYTNRSSSLILVTITQELGAMGDPLFRFSLMCVGAAQAHFPLHCIDRPHPGEMLCRPDRHRSRSKAAQLSIMQPDSPFAGLLRKTRSELLPF